VSGAHLSSPPEVSMPMVRVVGDFPCPFDRSLTTFVMTLSSVALAQQEDLVRRAGEGVC
jgi:hypothetical protein